MIKAILLDLDDTLLSNPLNRVGHSFDAWNTFFARITGQPDAGRGLAAAMAGVSSSVDPAQSNIEVFLDIVTRRWGVDRETAMIYFQAFYDEVYAQMRQHVQPREAAPMLLDWLRQAGYQIVIATNPLFSAEATSWRLGWGELPTDLTAYTLVTHIENFHFAKPTPHYYEEILGRLGIANNEALMVGDDWVNDITPAQRAGLNTFWIRPDGTPRESEDIIPDGEGTLNDFVLKVRSQGWLETLQPLPLQPSMIVPRLLGNVGALYGLLQEYAPEQWWQHPDPAEWSPLEVVCHLRDSEAAVQRPRLERIAAEDNPFLSAPLAPPGPGQIACDVAALHDPAEQFLAERRKTIAFLEALPPDAWFRPARHSIFGPTTLLEMADFTATHDRLHLRQICQTIGRCA